MSEMETVECCTHGEQQATFVCRHIVQSLEDNRARGFWWSSESDERGRPDAWCSKCEEVVAKSGGWDEESEKFAGVSLLCGSCYDEAKELNFDDQRKWWQVWK